LKKIFFQKRHLDFVARDKCRHSSKIQLLGFGSVVDAKVKFI